MTSRQSHLDLDQISPRNDGFFNVRGSLKLDFGFPKDWGCLLVGGFKHGYYYGL